MKVLALRVARRCRFNYGVGPACVQANQNSPSANGAGGRGNRPMPHLRSTRAKRLCVATVQAATSCSWLLSIEPTAPQTPRRPGVPGRTGRRACPGFDRYLPTTRTRTARRRGRRKKRMAGRNHDLDSHEYTTGATCPETRALPAAAPRSRGPSPLSAPETPNPAKKRTRRTNRRPFATAVGGRHRRRTSACSCSGSLKVLAPAEPRKAAQGSRLRPTALAPES